jgi:hypothetical protein
VRVGFSVKVISAKGGWALDGVAFIGVRRKGDSLELRPKRRPSEYVPGKTKARSRGNDTKAPIEAIKLTCGPSLR